MTLLICPVCDRPLDDAQTALHCAEGHSFDRAREGYVNLLAVGHGKSKIEGDPAEMLQARRRTFARGHYQPLSDAINAIGKGKRLVLDAGCGEGYYIGRLGADPTVESCYAFDISKTALKLAARAHPGVVFFGSDVKHRICMADGSVDLLLNVFAPRSASEFARVLAPGGELLVVIPGPDHFEPLRSDLGLLAIDDHKADLTTAQLGSHFEMSVNSALRYEISAGGEALADLLQMTPNYWHLSDQALADAGRAEPRQIQLSFQLMRFRRR